MSTLFTVLYIIAEAIAAVCVFLIPTTMLIFGYALGL